MSEKPDDVVGHKTYYDKENGYYHKPLTRAEADAIIKHCDERKENRAREMPTTKDALIALNEAYRRLEELGWRNAIYCPKDGTMFDAIEAGSTGIHKCNYHGKWPDGSWWVSADGDMCPSRPILFKLIEDTPMTDTSNLIDED